MDQSCDICRWTREPSGFGDLEISRTSRWVLRHHLNPAPLAGWVLLCSARHVQGPADLDDLECSELGPMLRAASRAVREVTGCDRVYAIAFGQGAPHLHVHLIPRFDAEAGTRAWLVADWYREVERGTRAAAGVEAVAAVVASLRRELRAEVLPCR